LINEKPILYVIEDKNKTDQWLNDNQLQLPLRSSTFGLVCIITYAGGKIKVSKAGNVFINS